MEDKREQRGAEAPHSSEPQKAHRGTSHWWVCCCGVKWWPFAAGNSQDWPGFIVEHDSNTTKQGKDSWVFASQVSIDVTAEWAASPVDIRPI